MTTDDLTRMSIAQLRDLAAQRGLPNLDRLSREDLILRLTAATGDPSRQMRAPAPSGSSTIENRPQAAPTNGPDPGLPIPDRYGRDRLVLMVQDPFHVFAYWEITDQTWATANAAAGGNGTPVLVLRTTNGVEQREVDLRGGNYYLSVAPNASYEAQLALRDAHGRLHILAQSNRVQTPAPGVSTRQDQAWMSVDETFTELLAMAGLPGQGGSSVGRLAGAAADQRIIAWTVHEVDHRSMFSGLLAGEGSVNLSSFSLSSTALYSGALQRPAADGSNAR